MSATHDLVTRTFVYTRDGMDAVTVTRDLPYGEGARRYDVYRPPALADSPTGVKPSLVVLANGYRDAALEAMLGTSPRALGIVTSWARLVAASGMTAVTYSAVDPSSDLPWLVDHLRERADELAIDASRLGLWAASGNGPVALAEVMRGDVTCAVLCNAFMLDLGGANDLASAARAFGFAPATQGRTLAELPPVPLMLVRSGADATPGLNVSFDRFVAAALTMNLPLTCVNLPHAPHAFELFDPSRASREVIASCLAFLQSHLV